MTQGMKNTVTTSSPRCAGIFVQRHRERRWVGRRSSSSMRCACRCGFAISPQLPCWAFGPAAPGVGSMPGSERLTRRGVPASECPTGDSVRSGRERTPDLAGIPAMARRRSGRIHRPSSVCSDDGAASQSLPVSSLRGSPGPRDSSHDSEVLLPSLPARPDCAETRGVAGSQPSRGARKANLAPAGVPAIGTSLRTTCGA